VSTFFTSIYFDSSKDIQYPKVLFNGEYCLLRQFPPLITYPDLHNKQVGAWVPLVVSIVHLRQPSPHATHDIYT